MNFLIAILSLSTIFALAGCYNQNASEPQNSSEPIAQATPSAETNNIVDEQPNSTAQNNQYIGKERAKEIALANAGLSAKDVKFIKAELDKDDATVIYEIDFKHGSKEYEADISATDGKILWWDVDIDD